ncbi:MAG TPA: nuclear transport factor 2 family protein [Burkholderiaceae bacterium]|nr:nuclear transport factor 2 family protein [Burkholderiaceae bacterium]
MTTRLAKPLLFASALECEEAFYEALQAGDADAVADLWLDDGDVCCVHPGRPRLLGHAAIKASWAAILNGGPLRVRVAARKVVETPTLTMHNLVEEVVVVHEREQQLVHVIATNAYVKTPAGWKMVLHHGSPVAGGQAEDIEIEERAGRLH